MKRMSVSPIGLGTSAGVAFTRWQMALWFAKQPEYQVEDHVGALEIRCYDRVVRAETRVDATSWDEALNEGIRRLASYIFGANRPREAFQPNGAARPQVAAIEPVDVRHQKIPITAPLNVRVEQDNLANLASAEDGSYPTDASLTVTFTMPKGRTGDSLPVPEDSRVQLRSVPPRRVAVLRYTGRYTARCVAEKSRALLEATRNAGLQTRGEPEFAGYNPPSTLPWLRRNEIWIELGGPTRGLKPSATRASRPRPSSTLGGAARLTLSLPQVTLAMWRSISRPARPFEAIKSEH